MWKNVVTDDNIIQLIYNACWITKATDTHSEYVIRTAFLQHQWLGECTCVTFTHALPVFLLHAIVMCNFYCLYLGTLNLVWRWIIYDYT
jgi:hypothetical protein